MKSRWREEREIGRENDLQDDSTFPIVGGVHIYVCQCVCGLKMNREISP